jgi:hypothetical protein
MRDFPNARARTLAAARPESRQRRHFLTALFFGALTLMVAGLTLPAFADSLDAAKARGEVGEKRNGYVGIVVSAPSADIVRMVDDINLRRRDAYRSIAEKTAGSTLAAVEQLAGAKLIGNAASGTYVEDASGNWVRKP